MMLWQSKFSGMPYLPKGTQYPKGTNGKPLFLLAQLNFDELPRLAMFPGQGILQFYITDNDMYGAQFDDMTRQGDFQIRYISEVIKNQEALITDFDFLPSFEFVPASKACSLIFELSQQSISVADYQFENKIFSGNIPEPNDAYYKFLGQYEEKFSASGHRIAGYPYFTQSDPRGNKKYINDDLQLLFQIDSDWNSGVMWGDAGVGNFFIREDDLKKCNFSKVMYNWDCC